MGFLLKVAITGVALWVATLLPGIDLDGDSLAANIGTLLAVAAIFGVINAVIKPIVTLLGLPLIILTLGLFTLVINALLFWLAGTISRNLDLPFSISGFWPAFWGAIVVTLTSWVLSIFFAEE